MRFCKLLLATLVVAAALGTLVGAASARNLSLSHQTFRATYANVEYQSSIATVRCPLTIEGSFHRRTIVKTVGSLVGYITAAGHGACSAPGATVLRETLPWHIRYASFVGTLPNVTGLNFSVIDYSVTIRDPFGSLCLIRSTATEPVTLAFTREGLTGISRANLSGTLETAGAACNGLAVTIVGPSTSITVLNSATRITLTLI
ncbi:MAG TPA: hypothetical protein VF250_15250 [Conexibacter sp.]